MKSSVPPEEALAESAHGRRATHPREIPRRGWRDVLWRVKDQIDADNVSIVAGGLALFTMLSVFPSLAAAVAIYGLFASPEQVMAQVQAFGDVLPPQALQIVQNQLVQITGEHRSSISIGLAVSVIVALWSARRGMTALITATNVAYNERDRRSFLHRLLVSSLLTVAAVFGFLGLVVLGIVAPVVVGLLPLGSAAESVLLVLRWILLWWMAVLALSVVYRFAPHRNRARWQWVTWGSGVAATLWILSSILFAMYVRNFNSFGEMYGVLGGVVVMLMWFYISAFIVILGAELNSELERQTVQDSTEGESKPMGQRGAFSADTVGPARS